MLERKEHKKMYKSGKNWAVVTLSTAALVLGATTVNASADTNTKNNDSSTVQVTTGDNDIAVKSVTLGSGQVSAASDATIKNSANANSASSAANTQNSNSQVASSAATTSSTSSAASSNNADSKVAQENANTAKNDDTQKAAPANESSEAKNEPAVNTNDSSAAKNDDQQSSKKNTAAKLNKDAENVVKKAGIDPNSLTDDQIKALNKINFSKTAKSGTQMTYNDFQKIADTLIKQDGRYTVPFFKASEIKNMPAATTKDAQTNTIEPLSL